MAWLPAFISSPASSSAAEAVTISRAALLSSRCCACSAPQSKTKKTGKRRAKPSHSLSGQFNKYKLGFARKATRPFAGHFAMATLGEMRCWQTTNTHTHTHTHTEDKDPDLCLARFRVHLACRLHRVTITSVFRSLIPVRRRLSLDDASRTKTPSKLK